MYKKALGLGAWHPNKQTLKGSMFICGMCIGVFLSVRGLPKIRGELL